MTLLEEHPPVVEEPPAHSPGYQTSLGSGSSNRKRVCIIGAGMTGLGLAHALQRDGVAFDVVEATGRLGGNWSHGVYDSAHLISSKRTTAYLEHPMPADYPDFPTAKQVLAYFDSYVERFGLAEYIEYNKEVADVSPIDDIGADGWIVSFADGDIREYAAVMVACGHDWSPKIPEYPGEFTGFQIHSKNYKNPSDVPGQRVLVVGAGNSAIDVAAELAEAKPVPVDVSMRRTYWFVPKTIFGRPTADFNQWWIPQVVQEPFIKALMRVTTGPHSRYGMPTPQHGLFTVSITVNDGFLHAVKHGLARYRPGITRLDGDTVHFTDGTSGQYDSIVWGTGFNVTVPFVDSKYIEYGTDEKPVLIARCIPSTGVRNLYLMGFAYPTNGGGPVISRAGRIVSQFVRLQWELPFSVARYATLLQGRTSNMVLNTGSFTRRVWLLAPPTRLALAAVDTVTKIRA